MNSSVLWATSLTDYTRAALKAPACTAQNWKVKLQGNWLLDRVWADGSNFRSATRIDSNGKYLCHTIQQLHSTRACTFDLEGTFEVKDGYLIDTVIKHSDPSFPVPSVFRARIIRMDDREVVIHDEANSVEAIFRKDRSHAYID